MSQDLSPKPSLLSRSGRPERRAKPETPPPDASSTPEAPSSAGGAVAELAPAEPGTQHAPIGPCAAALPQFASPVAIRSPVVVRKTMAGAMHLGPEAARLYTPAEALGLAREILRLFS